MNLETKKLLKALILLSLLSSLIFSTLQYTQATYFGNPQDQITAPLIIHEPIEIRNNNNFSDYSLPGAGTTGDPYRIENYNITTLNTVGILVIDTTDYFIIQNCYIDASFTAIGINNVTSGTGEISDVTCKENDFWAVVIIESSRIYIHNCIIEDNIDDFGLGIYLVESTEITVYNNTCNNNNYGLVAENTNSSVISYNTFSGNVEYGVHLSVDPNENIVHHNKFINNKGGAVMQARDDGINNIWYDEASKEGNYWDNWNDPDSVVPIGGTAGSEDIYPLDENLTREINLFFVPVVIALVIVVFRKRIKRSN